MRSAPKARTIHVVTTVADPSAESATTELEETACPGREDGKHCPHWYDGDACCGCNAPPMTAAQKASTGMPVDNYTEVGSGDPTPCAKRPVLATLYATTRSSGVTISIEVEVMRVEEERPDLSWVSVEGLDDRAPYRVISTELTKPNGDDFDADAARLQLEANATAA